MIFETRNYPNRCKDVFCELPQTSPDPTRGSDLTLPARRKGKSAADVCDEVTLYAAWSSPIAGRFSSKGHGILCISFETEPLPPPPRGINGTPHHTPNTKHIVIHIMM